MTSIEVPESTAAALRAAAARQGLSLVDYLNGLALDEPMAESLRQHAATLGERYFVDAEAERLAG